MKNTETNSDNLSSELLESCKKIVLEIKELIKNSSQKNTKQKLQVLKQLDRMQLEITLLEYIPDNDLEDIQSYLLEIKQNLETFLTQCKSPKTGDIRKIYSKFSIKVLEKCIPIALYN